MGLTIIEIDDILADLERLPQPNYEKMSREEVKRAMLAFLQAPGAMLTITAMHSLMKCKRCGGCCQFCNPISIGEGDIRAMAKHNGMTVEDFKEEYIIEYFTDSGNPQDRSINQDVPINIEMAMKKEAGEHCPFYKEDKGCSIYASRPSACRIFPYLQRDVIDSTENRAGIPRIINCPASVELSEMVKTFSLSLQADPGVFDYARLKVDNLDDMLIYILNLFLRGMEINDGAQTAQLWICNLGMDRLASDYELERLSLLICGVSIDFSEDPGTSS